LYISRSIEPEHLAISCTFQPDNFMEVGFDHDLDYVVGRYQSKNPQPAGESYSLTPKMGKLLIFNRLFK